MTNDPTTTPAGDVGGLAAAVQRIRTLAAAALTWIILGGAVATAVAQALTAAATNAAIDVAWLDSATRWLTVVAGALVTIAAAVRRVTEVIPEQRGLLPVDQPQPLKSAPTSN